MRRYATLMAAIQGFTGQKNRPVRLDWAALAVNLKGITPVPPPGFGVFTHGGISFAIPPYRGRHRLALVGYGVTVWLLTRRRQRGWCGRSPPVSCRRWSSLSGSGHTSSHGAISP